MPESPTEDAERAPLRLRWVVPALGIAQIISWGSLFYPIAVLAPAIRRDLALGDTAVFGSFTLGLFVSGIAAPAAGRLIDARGGRDGARRRLGAGGALALAALGARAGTVFTLMAGFALAGRRDGRVPLRSGVRDAASDLRHRLSQGA